MTSTQHAVSPTPRPLRVTETVTPELAAKWLEQNHRNRYMREDTVRMFIRAMTGGGWGFSTNPIAFNVNGMLLDGQHRLAAIARSGVSIAMDVYYNVPEDTVFDHGRSRTAADHLRFRGEQRCALIAATIRLLLNTQAGDFINSGAVSNWEIDNFLDANPSVRHSVDAASKATTETLVHPSALAAAHYLIAQVNGRLLADYYINKIATQADEPAGSAVHAINKRAIETRRLREKVSSSDYLYLLLKGWRYYAIGQPVQKLSIRQRSTGLPPVATWSR